MASCFWIDSGAGAKSLQSCPTLCDPRDGSPPGSPVLGILQARTLGWVAISFSNAWKWKVKVKSLSKHQTLHNPMDCSLPGSSVHGIFQARVLEWGAIDSRWEQMGEVDWIISFFQRSHQSRPQVPCWHWLLVPAFASFFFKLPTRYNNEPACSIFCITCACS